ncbi:MAG: hypothetical protein AAFV72_18005 [Cyanobacteria bacterium J06635_1]
MKIRSAIALSLVPFALSACNSQVSGPQAQDLPNATHPIEVTLQVDTTQPEPNLLRVRGETTLPNDFVMQIGVCRMLVKLDEASSETFSYGTCGSSTYYEIQRVEVDDQQFAATFNVPTVQETRKIQMNYVDRNPDDKARELVPWEFVKIEVDGFPSQQPDHILQMIGGPQGINLTGSRVREHRSYTSDSQKNSYNQVTWEQNLKL